MSRKFIPNGDFDFAIKAECFARNIAEEPAKFDLTAADAEELSAAAKQFRAALQACRSGGRSQVATLAKDDARAAAEKIMRRLGHLVRSNLRLDAPTKMSLGIQPCAEKPKTLPCPQEPPRLRFVRAHHESTATPMHELAFCSLDRKSRPPGAVRLELFVDLIPPGEPIPAYPGAIHGSRPWYLRSYTRSPIKLIPPMARVPMRVVYWARWADSQGNVGPFSATAVAWIEGGSHAMLPGAPNLVLGNLGSPERVKILEDASGTGPADRDPKYSVAVLEVFYGSMDAKQIAAVLPSPVQPERRQLEAPAENEAA